MPDQPVKYQHFVLTRYTVKGMAYEAFSQDWLKDRLNVFRSYCVPGMAQQINGNFAWLVFCDETTDADYVESVRASARFAPQMQVVPTSHERGVGHGDATAELVKDDTEVVIMTRLDNDDTFHAAAIERIQSYVDGFIESPHRRWFMNFSRGYRFNKATGQLYAANWTHGPFVSLFQKVRPGKAIRDVYSVNHTKLHHVMPAHLDESIPGWLQVIHDLAESTGVRSGVALKGGNLQSKVRTDIDIEVDPAELRDAFGVDLRQEANRSRATSS